MSISENQVVLTPGEAAVFLKVSARAVISMAKSGKIPAQRVGKRFRFHRAAIEEWLFNPPLFGPRQPERPAYFYPVHDYIGERLSRSRRRRRLPHEMGR